MAGNRVTLRPDLDEFVAQRFLAPAVARVRDQAADLARRYAPDARVWQATMDERTRPAHAAADTQTIPANLRFVLDKPDGGQELARAPRDPALSAANAAHCRCEAATVPGAVARTITEGPVVVLGTVARAEVEARFPRVVESEFPDAADGGGGWMRRALEETAAATRARAGRI